MVTFAELFKECLAPGESPEDASIRFNVSERTARLYYAGRSVPPVPKVPVLARKMGVPVDSLAPVCASDRRRLKKAREDAARNAVRALKHRKQVRNADGDRKPVHAGKVLPGSRS